MRTKLTISAVTMLIILWACLMMGGKVIEVGEHIDWGNSNVQKMHNALITEANNE